MLNFKSLTELLDTFKDEKKAIEYFEKIRWNGKPICPHCKSEKKPYKTDRGYKCSDNKCYKKFTVKVGTIFEDSKIPFRVWFAAIFLCTSNKKGISSMQLSRTLGITQKTSWFILHRVREMLKVEVPTALTGKIEMDETVIGGKENNKHTKIRNRKNKGTGVIDKTIVFGVLQRNGIVWTKVVADSNGKTLKPIIRTLISKKATIITDGHGAYYGLDKEFKQHEILNHSKHEYVRGDYYTNSIEGFWALLKRGIIGVYHQISEKHLHRYCHEFSSRYNTRKMTDSERFNKFLGESLGRLTYQDLIAKSTTLEA